MDKKTLKQAIIEYGECDIADNVFDFLVFFGIDTEKKESEMDYYDKVINWFADNIEFERVDWWSNGQQITCKISAFIDNNRAIFENFLNQVYQPQYQPQNNDYIESESDEFYDFYMEMFEGLVSGNFSEKDYEILFDIIARKGA